MELNKHIKEYLLQIRVTPNSSKNELVEENGKLKLFLKAIPEKGKANKEIIKFFKKNYSLKVEIKSGETSRNKVLKVIN